MSKENKNVDAKVAKRHFQYIDPSTGKATGRYSGVKPKQAGNKVYSSVWRDKKSAGKPLVGEFKFAIRECTRNSRRKVYYYIGKRVKLDKPTKVNIKDGDGETKVVEYNYSNKVMKDKEATRKAALKAKKEEKENRKTKNKKGKKKQVKKTKTTKSTKTAKKTTKTTKTKAKTTTQTKKQTKTKPAKKTTTGKTKTDKTKTNKTKAKDKTEKTKAKDKAEKRGDKNKDKAKPKAKAK